ncbi:hypothetical protein [Clostridium magnum]|uniref:TrbL/VirB6 plasmid conjugal transfer protein n=1 Tax=Clostridium magnum DSM 2767 TaxID=1121326 RepID=A0A162TJC9_9CLOT|nr:hypothetical protein [Clostridium magnum]KZL92720.1 hypothetical protein CLMAG_25340 [Clostridium magnum DSM 2767]SHI24743.1 hypothetical protein SAMN02745944_03589 [Clostridium magnum DSM 2767]
MKQFAKYLLDKYKKINKKQFVITFGLALLITVVFSPHALASADKPNIGERILAGMVNAMAEGLNAIVSGLGTIDKLLFNVGNEKTMGLTLLANDKLSTYIFRVYQDILSLAALAFVPMGLVIGVDFVRSQDNAQHKAILKEKLLRFVLTFILLTSMPVIMDMLFTVNNELVKLFNAMGQTVLQGSGVEIKKGFLVEAFQKKALDGSLLDACIYMMTVVLNGWLVFYYMIRDLTISFLFLLFPIIAIFYPFQKGKVVGWFKEMCSNIYSQVIQAGIMAIILGMCATMSDFGKVDQPTTMYQSLFALVAFASIIPMTSVLKRMVGLEGNVGAASSMAGVGALMGAMALAKGATTSIKQGVGNIREGRAELKDLNAQEQMLKNNVSTESSVDNKELSPIHAQPQLNMEQIQSKRAEARRKITQGAVNLGGSAWVGSTWGIGGSVLGGKGAAAGVAAGVMAGGYVGDKAGKKAYDVGANLKEKGQDIAFGVGVRPDLNGITEGNEQIFKGGLAHSIATGNFKEDFGNSISTIKGNLSNMKENVNGNYIKTKTLKDLQGIRTKEDKELIANRYAGVDNEIFDKDPEFQKQEQVAMATKKRYERLGQHDKAFRAYAKHTPTRNSPEELEKIEGLMMYRDKDMSVAYTQKEVEVDVNGKKEKQIQREVHWTGTGDPSIVYPQVQPITFNDGSTDLTSDRIREIYDVSQSYADSVVPITENSSKEDKALNSQMQKQYYNQAIKSEQERIVKVRVELGSNRAYIPTAPETYKPIPNANRAPLEESASKVEELDFISQKLMEQASRLASVHGEKVQDPNVYVTGNI